MMFATRSALACAVMALMSSGAPAADSAEAEKQRAEAEISRLVSERNFRGIERRLEQEARQEARFSDGLWRQSLDYSYFGAALRAQVTDDPSWDRTAKELFALARSNPKAWLLYEEAIAARAWSIRGPGFASEVAPDSWRMFHHYLTEARDVLQKNKQRLATNPTWYSLRLSLATELSEPDAKTDVLFEEAVARHPRYHAIYFARMRYLTPIWHGSKERMLDLLDRVAELGGRTSDEALYVRLVWLADGLGFPLTHAPRINEEAMRASSRALAATYPVQWNLQMLFFMACERSDKTLALAMRPLVEDPPLASLLGRNVPVYESCKQWAEGSLPSFVIRDHDHGETKEYWVK